MYFVDQINLVSPLGRRVANIFAELSNVFDTVVAGTIDLDDIETVAGGNLATVIAFAAWRDGRPFHAIEGLRQNSRSRCFTDAAWANKQISMGQAILRDRILQRARHMRLADQIVECLRPIFSGKNLVTHSLNLNGKVDRW